MEQRGKGTDSDSGMSPNYELVKLSNRCQELRQPDATFSLHPAGKVQSSNQGNNRRVKAGGKCWYFWSPNLASIHSLLLALSSSDPTPQN
jgi:hypothetical protein